MALDAFDDQNLWVRYGIYADLRVRCIDAGIQPAILRGDGEMPLRFEDWLIEEQRLAGEQDELF